MPKLSVHLWRKRAAIVAVAVFGTLAAAPLTATAAVRDGGAYPAAAGIAVVRPAVFRRFAARRFGRDDFRRFDRDGRFAFRRDDRDGFRRYDRDGFRRFDWR